MTTQDVRPLEGIRVLAVTVYLAGPFLGMTLARFGAEVNKIEMPGLSLIHISEPTRQPATSRMPSSA